VATDCHRDTFTYTCTHHVPHARATQIMNEFLRQDFRDDRLTFVRPFLVEHHLAFQIAFVHDLARQVCVVAGPRPRLAKFPHSLTVTVKYIRRYRRTVLRLVFACGPLRLDDLRKLALEDELVRSAILRCLRSRQNHASASIDVTPLERCNLPF